MKKDTSTPSLSPKIQEALEKASSTFGKISNRYDLASQDIKLTEKQLGGQDVKSTFVINFGRIEDMYNGDGSESYPSWDPDENGYETLDWRKDPESDRFRLMVSEYGISRFGNDQWEVWLFSTKPLIESPIDIRLYYHARLATFITTFSDAIERHLIKAGSQVLDVWYRNSKTDIPEFSHKLRSTELNLRTEENT
jgi:hypothetical protein